MMQILLTVFCEDGGKICFSVIGVSAFMARKEKGVVPQQMQTAGTEVFVL